MKKKDIWQQHNFPDRKLWGRNKMNLTITREKIFDQAEKKDTEKGGVLVKNNSRDDGGPGRRWVLGGGAAMVAITIIK